MKDHVLEIVCTILSVMTLTIPAGITSRLHEAYCQKAAVTNIICPPKSTFLRSHRVMCHKLGFLSVNKKQRANIFALWDYEFSFITPCSIANVQSFQYQRQRGFWVDLTDSDISDYFFGGWAWSTFTWMYDVELEVILWSEESVICLTAARGHCWRR